jgi:hypothetical protein
MSMFARARESRRRFWRGNFGKASPSGGGPTKIISVAEGPARTLAAYKPDPVHGRRVSLAARALCGPLRANSNGDAPAVFSLPVSCCCLSGQSGPGRPCAGHANRSERLREGSFNNSRRGLRVELSDGRRRACPLNETLETKAGGRARGNESSCHNARNETTDATARTQAKPVRRRAGCNRMPRRERSKNNPPCQSCLAAQTLTCAPLPPTPNEMRALCDGGAGWAAPADRRRRHSLAQMVLSAYAHEIDREPIAMRLAQAVL